MDSEIEREEGIEMTKRYEVTMNSSVGGLLETLNEMKYVDCYREHCRDGKMMIVVEFPPASEDEIDEVVRWYE